MSDDSTVNPAEQPEQPEVAGVPATSDAASPQAIGTADAGAQQRVLDDRSGAFGIQGSPDVSGYGMLDRAVRSAPPAERPFGGWYDTVADELIADLGTSAGQAIEQFSFEGGDFTIHVNRENLPAVLQSLRDKETLRFELSLGVSGVHWPADAGRELHAVYHLRSLTHKRFIRVETTCPDSDPHIPSTVQVYPTHDWHERETWDMFGIVFDDHPHLTRILMPDDWPGHPQRKDYPLGGIPVEYKGATTPAPDHRRSYN